MQKYNSWKVFIIKVLNILLYQNKLADVIILWQFVWNGYIHRFIEYVDGERSTVP
jgi:hypothetical protein